MTIINQHTNNFGDDVAGASLVSEVVRSLGADRVDIFYIWHKSRGGIPLTTEECQHHLLDDLAGVKDVRPIYAVAVAFQLVFRRILPRDMRVLVDRCRSADVVFVSPAGSNIGIYKDWMYLFVLMFVVGAGVRPIFCQNTIGASRSRAFNAVARRVLRRSSVFVREQASETWLASQGVGSYLGVDTAFLLADGTTSDADLRAAEDRPPYVAVVPTGLSNWHRDHREFDDRQFLESVLPDAISRIARDRGVDVVLVPHLYGPEGEPELLNGLRERLEEAGCRAYIADDVNTYVDYATWLRGANAVVSMRYHGLIVAGLYGVPCVSISYENKMVEAARYLSMADLALSVGAADVDGLASRLDDALGYGPGARRDLRLRADGLRAIAMGPVLSAQSGLFRSEWLGE